MRINYLSSDILLFRGASMAALATAFIDGERVLLVDALASRFDAADMRDYLENSLQKRVEMIVLSSADGSHRAAVDLFPAAQLVTHEQGLASIGWGRHTLHLAAGAAPGSLAIDVPSAALVFAVDSVAGRVAVLGTLAADCVDAGLARLQAMEPVRVVARRGTLECGQVLGQARAYLARLRAAVLAVRSSARPGEAEAAIKAIALEDLVPPGAQPGALELHWHRDNLRRVAERGLFPATEARVPLVRAGSSLGQACRMTLAGVLTALLGGMGRSGL